MSALAAIHVGKKALGLDEETYRDLLSRVTGKRSAKDLSPAEAEAVIAEMRRLGFKPASKPSSRRATGPYRAKLQALWIAGFNLGVVRNREDAAMIAFAERQTGLAHTRFLTDPADAAKAIEALKAWLSREAGVDWTVLPARQAPRPHVNDPRYRIAAAQWRRLIALGVVYDPDALELAYGYRVTGKGAFQFYQSEDWIKLMNALGAKLRATLAKKSEAA
jgi:hypothetical protein